MSEFRSLKMVDLFRPLFEAIHVDYPTMRHILHVKLLMDSRRVPTIFNDVKKPKGNQFIKSLGMYALFGLLLIFFIFGDDYMFQMSIIFGIAMFILMSAMIADFSVVLLDIRDKTIIATKPVDERTISAAKFVHIIIYMALLTGAFIGIPVIVMVVVQGFGFALIFVFSICFFVLFIISLTAIIYLVVLRFFSGEQLKNMINYIQILLSIGVFIGYQIVIRVFDIVDYQVHYVFSWWHALIPPVWFAAPFELLLKGNTATGIILLSCLAILIPIIAIWLYYVLMPSFEANLEKLLHTGTARKKEWRIRRIWERLICRTEIQRAYFRFAHKAASEEREFKLKVYPTIGMGIIFPFLFLFTGFDEGGLAEIADSNSYFTIYFSHIIIGIIVYMLQFSNQYKGAWIFRMVDIKQPKLLYSAAIKVFLTKYYTPIFIFVGGAYFFIFSKMDILDLGIVFLSALIQTLISYHIAIKEEFPFSAPFESLKEGGYTAKSFLMMFLTAPFVLFHYFVSIIPYGAVIYFVLLLIVTIISWRATFKKN